MMGGQERAETRWPRPWPSAVAGEPKRVWRRRPRQKGRDADKVKGREEEEGEEENAIAGWALAWMGVGSGGLNLLWFVRRSSWAGTGLESDSRVGAIWRSAGLRGRGPRVLCGSLGQPSIWLQTCCPFERLRTTKADTVEERDGFQGSKVPRFQGSQVHR